MALVSFRAKAEKIYNMDNTLAYVRIKVPALKRAHCDMNAFRQHPRFGAYANSDMFEGILKRQAQERFPSGYIRLDHPIPDGVVIDQRNFLATVSFDL